MKVTKFAQTLYQGQDTTVTAHGIHPTSGFVVAVADALVDPSLETLTGWVESHMLDSDTFGKWTDQDGKVYYDCVIVTSRETAMKIATAKNEIAIYDLTSNTEVRL